VASDAVSRSWIALQRYDGSGKRTTLCYVVAQNVVRSFLRDSKSSIKFIHLHGSVLDDPDDHGDWWMERTKKDRHRSADEASYGADIDAVIDFDDLMGRLTPGQRARLSELAFRDKKHQEGGCTRARSHEDDRITAEARKVFQDYRPPHPRQKL
jgi:DNA-directed RNA polymerase specialized sigma24 family protein